MSRSCLLIGLALAAFNAHADHPGLDFGADTAGPIRTIGAATLHKGETVAGAQIEYVRNKQFSDDQLTGFAAQDVATNSTSFRHRSPSRAVR